MVCMVFQESVPSIPSAPKPMSYPSIVVYEGNGVQIAFDFEKPADMPHVTNISAKYVNTGSIPVENFTVQVAVPKFMQLQLEPATGTTLLPNGQGSVTQNIHITNTQYEQEVSQFGYFSAVPYILYGARAFTLF